MVSCSKVRHQHPGPQISYALGTTLPVHIQKLHNEMLFQTDDVTHTAAAATAVIVTATRASLFSGARLLAFAGVKVSAQKSSASAASKVQANRSSAMCVFEHSCIL